MLEWMTHVYPNEQQQWGGMDMEADGGLIRLVERYLLGMLIPTVVGRGPVRGCCVGSSITGKLFQCNFLLRANELAEG